MNYTKKEFQCFIEIKTNIINSMSQKLDQHKEAEAELLKQIKQLETKEEALKNLETDYRKLQIEYALLWKILDRYLGDR